MNSTKMEVKEYDTQLILSSNNVDVHNQKYDIKQECDKNMIEVKVEPCDVCDGNLNNKKDVDIVNWTAEHFNKDLIKEELCSEPEIKQGDYSEQYIKQEEKIVDEATENLFNDHIIKDELVIGPEIVQQIIQPTFLVCKEEVDRREPKLEEPKNSHKCLYICDYCGKSYKQRKMIEQHINQHVLSENKCNVCGKCFSYTQNLVRHMTIHSGKKLHKCLQCDSSFSRNEHLRVHTQRYHAKFTPLTRTQRATSVCNLCKKVFSSKCSRDHHIQFSCPKNKDKLKQQRKKLYLCDVCNRFYIHRTSLASHIRRQHTKESLSPLHECDHCGKKYMQKHSLQCHMLAHHLNIKPYKCKICKETFAWHSTLSAHEKKQHGKVKKKFINFIILKAIRPKEV